MTCLHGPTVVCQDHTPTIPYPTPESFPRTSHPSPCEQIEASKQRRNPAVPNRGEEDEEAAAVRSSARGDLDFPFKPVSSFIALEAPAPLGTQPPRSPAVSVSPSHNHPTRSQTATRRQPLPAIQCTSAIHILPEIAYAVLASADIALLTRLDALTGGAASDSH